MKFGSLPVDAAVGAMLAHAVDAGARRLRKAHRLTAEDVADLHAAGIASVVAVTFDADDVAEDEAATRIVSDLLFSGVDARPAATGRVNLHAREAGIFTVDAALIDAINAVDPAITIATLPQHAEVERGRMVATVKIIPFAVPGPTLDKVAALVSGHTVFAVHPYQPRRVALLQTTLPGLKPGVLAKTAKVTAERLARSGSVLAGETRVPHDPEAVAEALVPALRDSDMAMVFGASAMCDFDDVIPAAIRAAGGTVLRAGMPVDPGNLLVLGEIGGKKVLGAPGCARSPKENGFDWVLARLVAGLEVTDRDIARMGVGGLLMEIPSRPQPREAAADEPAPTVHAVVLAAGRSSRMGGPNKLLALFGGEPLVRRTVERTRASRAAGVTVVTGHQADRIRAALFGLDVAVEHNADFASGLSGSLRAGIGAMPSQASGALVVLGDMPGVTTADLNRMIEAFAQSGGHSVVRATHNSKRGNPVILPRALFPSVADLEGDTGARHLVEAGGVEVIDVEIGDGASLDVDTREAMEGAGGVLQD
ncbi:MAG: molybdopterin-binding/glycosyltransferase family 2 protein [Rhizobiaceae bacterium]|nr:molybdopterin-binding/glycosyltransferase family 2 protein [Rhizobiaceae bacterium]